LNNINIKLKEIYVPFLVVSIATILFYNLLRWALDIKLGIIPLKEDLLDFWIPFVLPWIPILIWLRRRIRILNVIGKNDNGFFLYQAVMAGTIFASLMNSQEYIKTSSFDLKEVRYVQEIKGFKNEKYFKIQSYDVLPEKSVSYATARTSGRNSENLSLYLYYASPFLNAENIWYGVKYQRRLSNRESKERKNAIYKSFSNISDKEYNNHNFNIANYFEKLSYSDDKDGFIEAVQIQNPNLEENDLVILMPKTESFNNRLGNSLSWAFGSFGIGAFVLLIMVLIPKINQKELNDFKKGKPSKDDDVKDLLIFFNPMGKYKATAILLLINILVFIIIIGIGLNIISPTASELLEVGGNRRFEVVTGDYWRLVTSVFIHGGLMHLIMNIMGLGIGSSLLEGILGSVKLIFVYLVCGILASLASIYWYENAVSVGASGAIFGLYGVILAFIVFKVYPKSMRGIMWLLLGVYAGVSLFFGFLIEGIDNAAHLGGLLGGFLIGGVLATLFKEQLRKKT